MGLKRRLQKVQAGTPGSLALGVGLSPALDSGGKCCMLMHFNLRLCSVVGWQRLGVEVVVNDSNGQGSSLEIDVSRC